MDSRDHFIEDTDIRHEKIVLTWRASAFIESLPNEMTIQEVLHSNTFDTKAGGYTLVIRSPKENRTGFRRW